MPSRSCIVVADDNHDAADTLAQLLDLMGYDAVAVYDGEQAVRACHALHPDLAILDVPDYRMMPYHFGMNPVVAVIKKGRLVWRR